MSGTTDKPDKGRIRMWSWGNVTFFGALGVVCMFLNFCITERQKDFCRFSEIKPIFETFQDGKDGKKVVALLERCGHE